MDAFLFLRGILYTYLQWRTQDFSMVGRIVDNVLLIFLGKLVRKYNVLAKMNSFLFIYV